MKKMLIAVMAFLTIASSLYAGSYHKEEAKLKVGPFMATYFLGDGGNTVDSIQVDSIDTPYIRIDMGQLWGYDQYAVLRIQIVKTAVGTIKKPIVDVRAYSSNKISSGYLQFKNLIVADTGTACTTAAILETIPLSAGRQRYLEVRFQGITGQPSATYVKAEITIKRSNSVD